MYDAPEATQIIEKIEADGLRSSSDKSFDIGPAADIIVRVSREALKRLAK